MSCCLSCKFDGQHPMLSLSHLESHSFSSLPFMRIPHPHTRCRQASHQTPLERSPRLPPSPSPYPFQHPLRRSIAMTEALTLWESAAQISPSPLQVASHRLSCWSR